MPSWKKVTNYLNKKIYVKRITIRIRELQRILFAIMFSQKMILKTKKNENFYYLLVS